MSAIVKPTKVSYAEYLERERIATTKSEYFAGEVFAMAGASRRHNSITGNVFADLSVVCGQLEGDKVDPEAITNPRVLVEVLSDSTESYDRGKKFDFYRQIDSLEEYVLISQKEPIVERFKRQPNGDWLLTVYKGLDTSLELISIQVELPLRDIYRFVDWSTDVGD